MGKERRIITYLYDGRDGGFAGKRLIDLSEMGLVDCGWDIAILLKQKGTLGPMAKHTGVELT